MSASQAIHDTAASALIADEQAGVAAAPCGGNRAPLPVHG